MPRRYSTANRPRRSGKASGARGWYDSAEWKQRSREHLERNPSCVFCGEKAQLCDHVDPVRPDDREGVLRGPIQSSCRRCHFSKSRKEQGDRGVLPKARGGRVRIDPKTGLPLPGQAHHWWSNTE